MVRKPNRFHLILALVVAGLGIIQGFPHVPLSVLAAPLASGSHDKNPCLTLNPNFKSLTVAVNDGPDAMVVGQVFSANDGTLAVLTVISDVDDDGDTQGIDFVASLKISALIISASGGTETVTFDPPVRSASDQAADDRSALDHVTFCYLARLPEPAATDVASPVATEPATATTEPTLTPTATATETSTAIPTAVPTETATATATSTSTPDVQATKTIEASQTAAAASATTAADEAATATAAAQSASSTAAAEQTKAAATPEPTNTTVPSATATVVPTETVAPSATTAPTETETVAPTETEVPPATDTPTETVTATETPAATETETAVPTVAPVYAVPDTEGFDAWTVPGGWTVVNGVLTADGTDFQGYAQPNRSIDLANYAVEVELRVVEQPTDCGGNIGIVTRGNDSGFYAGGLEWVCGQGSTVKLWAYDRVLKEQPITLTGDWMTMRIETTGDQVRLFVNGTQIAEVTDGTFPSGGQIALWSNRIKLEVRAVRVIPLS